MNTFNNTAKANTRALKAVSMLWDSFTSAEDSEHLAAANVKHANQSMSRSRQAARSAKRGYRV